MPAEATGAAQNGEDQDLIWSNVVPGPYVRIMCLPAVKFTLDFGPD